MDGPKAVTVAFDLVPEAIIWERLIQHGGGGADSCVVRAGAGGTRGRCRTRSWSRVDGYAEYEVSGATGYTMFGLSHGDTDGSYIDIDYALYTYPPSGALMVFERGVYKAGRGRMRRGTVCV